MTPAENEVDAEATAASQPRAAGTAFELLDAAAASPAYSLWLAAPLAERPGRLRFIAGALALLMLIAAVGLLVRPVRWPIVSVIWLLYNALTPLGIALWAKTRAAAERPTAAPGWGAFSLRALPIIFVVMPSLVVFSRLLGAASIGDTLARANPDVADPEALATALSLSILWAVPLGTIFTIVAARRGRLRTAGDLMRATFAWIWVLVLYEVVIEGSLAVLRTQLIGTLEVGPWAEAQPLLVRAGLIYFMWRVASWLAWGRSPAWQRAATATVAMLLSLINVGLLVGLLSQVQFGLGRYLERLSEPGRAIRWYERTLITRSSPAVESYLAHRLGLLRYKLGDTERAIDTFRLAQTSHNENAELTRQSGYYLDRLEGVKTGARVVLQGVETATERRAAYCAPNTLSLVLNYWHRDMTPSEIGEQIAGIGTGTQLSDIRLLIEAAGLEFRLAPFATVADVRWLIDHEIPAVLFLPGHVMSVFGYDDRLGTWVTFDTATWDIWVDQPIADLLQQWGEREFLLGVVLPADADPAIAAQVAARFPEARSRATWHLALGRERSGSDAEQQFRRALTDDASFFPALFASPRFHEHAWVAEHADSVAATAEAKQLAERDHAPVGQIGSDLGAWYHSRGEFQEVLGLHASLARFNLDSDSELHHWAGRSAASLGEWERAAALLSESAPREGIAALELLLAQAKLGRTEVAATLARDIGDEFGGDQLLAIVKLAEGLGVVQEPAYWEELYSFVSAELPADVDHELRLAQFSIESIEQGDQARDRRERRQRARRAATIAAALAETATDRQRARELLARVDALVQ